MTMLLCLCIPVFADETQTTTLTFTVYENGLTFGSTESGSMNYPTAITNKTFTAASGENGTLTYSIQSQKNSSNTTVSYFTIGSGASFNVAANTPAGTYTIVIRASAAGDSTHVAATKDKTYTLTVNSPLSFTTPQSGSLTYSASSDQNRSFTAATSGSGGTISYSIQSQKNSSNTTVSYFSIPTATTASFRATSGTPAGTYTIVIRATDSVTSLYKDCTYTLTVNKASGSVVLSAESGTLVSPSTGTFTINTNTSGGDLTVTSDTTSVATFSRSGTTVTITPAAVSSDGGTSVITVTSAATANYNSASATYTVTVNRGTITLTATAKNAAYSGSEQYAQIKSNVAGVTIVSGSTTSYGTSITTNATANTNYNLKPGQTNVTSAQTVYYKATKAGYKDATGSTTVTITKASNPVAYANQTWSYNYATSAQTKTLAEATNNQGAVTYSLQSQKNSSNTTVNYFTFNTSTRVLTAAANTPAGTYTVVVRASAAGNDNYNSGTADSTVTVTIQGRQLITVPTEVTVGGSATITYDVLGYDMDISVESENDFHLVYADDAVAYTMTESWSDLTGTGSLDMNIAVTGNANYAEEYSDLLTFSIVYTPR